MVHQHFHFWYSLVTCPVILVENLARIFGYKCFFHIKSLFGRGRVFAISFSCVSGGRSIHSTIFKTVIEDRIKLDKVICHHCHRRITNFMVTNIFQPLTSIFSAFVKLYFQLKHCCYLATRNFTGSNYKFHTFFLFVDDSFFKTKRYFKTYC